VPSPSAAGLAHHFGCSTVHEHAMSADAPGEPVRRADDVLGRLAAIDHRLHHISTQLTTIGKSLSRLDEIGADLETLIGSLRLAGRS
jgi:hypothetical protein